VTTRSLRWRRATPSAAFTSTLLVVLVLAYLTLTHVGDRPNGEAMASRPTSPAAIEFDRFHARVERGSDGERLTVSLRLRSPLPTPPHGFLFIVARNDYVDPHLWAIWPADAAGPAITQGGHFHGATPSSGAQVTLTEQWQAVSAALPYRHGQHPFETVVLYFVSPEGRILLTRPFDV
jgi:hypothetical protein